MSIQYKKYRRHDSRIGILVKRIRELENRVVQLESDVDASVDDLSDRLDDLEKNSTSNDDVVKIVKDVIEETDFSDYIKDQVSDEFYSAVNDAIRDSDLSDQVIKALEGIDLSDTIKRIIRENESEKITTISIVKDNMKNSLEKFIRKLKR
jgi:sugar-specific transcriptional regulator TrmB